MKRSALLLVSDIDIHPSFRKVEDAESLVFLSGNVQDTCSKLVSYVDVSTSLFNQEMKHCVIAVLGYVV